MAAPFSPPPLLLLADEDLYPPGCFGPLDGWLRDRLLLTLHLLAAQPDVPLCRLGISRAERTGAYRMVEHEEVSFQRLLKPAADSLGRAAASGLWGDVLLCVHDRTEVDTSHLAMADVGTTGNPLFRGFFLQTSLLLQPQEGGAALGALAAHTWVRPPKARGKAKKRKSRRFDQKESALWWRAMQTCERRVGKPGRLLHLIDAEGDVFELAARAHAQRYRVLFRAAQDRRVEGPHSRLWATLESLPEAGRRTLSVSAHPGDKKRKVKPRKARKAQLSVRFCPVVLPPPPRAETQQALPLYAVLVREEGTTPEGEKPLEWLLLTNMPVESLEAALGVVDVYTQRWTIEELHKALKTGCALEERQHTERQSLENLLALLLLTSSRLLRLRTLARTRPDAPAEAALEPDEVAVLELMAPRLAPRMPKEEVRTLAGCVLLLAALGGYVANPKKRPPGWLVLLRGAERLRERVEGFRLARALYASGPPPA